MSENKFHIEYYLKQKGINDAEIWYEYDIPGAGFSGWYYKNKSGDEYFLGRNKAVAIENIQNGKIKKMED